jgi:hypothetical protein
MRLSEDRTVGHLAVPALAAAAAVALGLLLLTDQPRIAADEPEDWPSLVATVSAEGHDGDLLLTSMLVRPPFDCWELAGELYLVRLEPVDHPLISR